MLSSIFGQQKLKDRLTKLVIDGQLPHLLLCGSPEMGKKTIAATLASELCSNPKMIDSARMRDKLDVSGVLVNIEPNDVVVLPSVDALPTFATEMIMEAIGDFRISLIVGESKGTTRVHAPLPRFTLIATTERVWQLDIRVRRLFVLEDLEPYSLHEISQLIQHLAAAQRFNLSSEAAIELALRANGSPGNAEGLVNRIDTQRRTSEVNIVEVNRILDRLGLNRP